jgi:Type I phosphodiesterase / nucleotide pyrophosphatase
LGIKMAEIFALAEKILLTRQKLPEAFGNEAIRPSYDGLGLANIAALPIHWLCPEAPSLSDEPALPPFNPELLAVSAVTEVWENWLSLGQIKHVVLLVMDGFGYDQLRSLITQGDAPGLAVACGSPQAFFMPATTVFPSTTVTALTSAATGYAPAQHGVMCTNAYLREIGSLVSLLRWRPALAPTSAIYLDSQLNPDTFVPVPNIYLRMEKAGVNVEIVNYHAFKQTSISRYTTAGSQAGISGYTGYLTPADGFAQLRDRVLAKYDKGKSFTYMYVPNIDSAAHRFAPLNSYYRAEVAALDFALKREILAPLAGRSDIVLLLTADHGQRCLNPDKILWLEEHPELTKLLFVPPSGEGQARFLHLKHGAEAAAKDYIQKHLAEHFSVISKAEAVELGLFGIPNQPLSMNSGDRVGDLILVPRTGWTCYAQKRVDAEGRPAVNAGNHGGFSRAEMLIPFLAYRF